MSKWIGPTVLFICLGATAMWIFQVLHPTSSEIEDYRALIAMNQEMTDAPQPVHTREGVQRDIFLWQAGQEQRLHMRLKSNMSTLLFSQEALPFSQNVIEEFQGLEGWMQEALIYMLPDGRQVKWQSNGHWVIEGEDPLLPNSWIQDLSSLTPMQIVRVFVADKGTFDYTKKQLEAKQVQITRYLIAGHQNLVPDDKAVLLMKGHATRILLQMGDSMLFNAEHLQATFFTSPL